MLTKEQLDKLQPLTNHPKYGKLLEAAIPTWKKVKPASNHMGMAFKNGKIIKNKDVKGCCLIGASVWKKRCPKPHNPFFSVVSTNFNISEKDFQSLIDGFDAKFKEGCRESDEINDAFIFGMLVREIVLC